MLKQHLQAKSQRLDQAILRELMMDVEVQCTKWDYREQGKRNFNAERQEEVTEEEEKSTTSEVEKDKEIEKNKQGNRKRKAR